MAHFQKHLGVYFKKEAKPQILLNWYRCFLTKLNSPKTKDLYFQKW